MFTALSSLLARRPVILQLLRFACIGALNTAMDFIILNMLTRYTGIQEGTRLGFINIVGVTAAIVQSYFWNKYWAFAANQSTQVVKQFFGMVFVGGAGFLAFAAAVLPSLSSLFPSLQGFDPGPET